MDPGGIYHIKAMQILGRNDLPAEAMSTAPTVGDVYSAARINKWIATLKSQYNRALSWGVRCDHATADCTIEVGPDTHPPSAEVVILRQITVENSQHFVAGPAEQESGADWRAVELHPLNSSAFHGALLRQQPDCRWRLLGPIARYIR